MSSILSGGTLLLLVGLPSSPFNIQSLLLVPIGIFIGHLSTLWIHNASHNSFKPLWLNPIIGEISSLLQFSAGFAVFRYIHMAHHSYPDDPRKDPHPSRGYELMQYIESVRMLISKWLYLDFSKRWGNENEVRNSWKRQSTYLQLSRYLQIIFLLLLMGPQLFLYLNLPLYYAYVFFFFYFNFRSHKENKNGDVEILNLNDTIYCKLCNFFLAGAMYHRNHHERPKAFNPKKIDPG